MNVDIFVLHVNGHEYLGLSQSTEKISIFGMSISHHTALPATVSFHNGTLPMDAILVLRLLSELHQEFGRPINVAYINIKAAFDYVDHHALWKALRATGVSRS